MDLRDLTYFQRVAELGHLGRAAEQLGRTQPALSKSIRRLEDSIGAKLFERVGRGLRLTIVGETLLARARQMRGYMDMTLRELGDVARGEVGHVRVGSAATMAEFLLPSLFGQLLKDAPGMTIELSIGMNDVLRSALRQGKLDLILSPLSDSDDEFSAIPLLDDEVVVVARQGHPLVSRPIELAEMEDCRWVLPGPLVAMRQWLDHAFTSRGYHSPQVQIETSSMSLLPRVIAETDLLSFISARNLGPGRVGEPLRALRIPEIVMRRRLGVLYQAERYLSPAARRLIDIAGRDTLEAFNFPVTAENIGGAS